MSSTPFNPALAVHDLVQDLKWDAALRERFARDEAAVYDRYALLPAERAALERRDFRALFAELVQTGRMIDLSHPMEAGMPVFPQHGPFTMALHRRHGDPHARPRAGGSSFANEMIVMPGHVATHIDALGHFSRCGCVYGGRRAADTGAGALSCTTSSVPRACAAHVAIAPAVEPAAIAASVGGRR